MNETLLGGVSHESQGASAGQMITSEVKAKNKMSYYNSSLLTDL